MSGAPPTYIGFAEYVAHVPRGIPAAVQRAASQLLSKRATRVAETPEWEQLRQIASDMRLHTLEHLDIYLERLEAQATAAGVKVHWARDAAEARVVVLDIARRHHVTSAVKSKSMATEEIGLNQALEDAGIEAIETDLGEYIVQLDGTGPSHIIVPAVHLTKEAIADLFRRRLNREVPADPALLSALARDVLREKFLRAGMGISGANFLVAETGTLVMVTNEGNGRMCTSLPNVHVVVAGIDKVIPDWESLAVFLKLLAPSATGQKLTAYTSFITGPRRDGEEIGPKEVHLVLLDNGRSKVLRDPVGREALKCIRCGACLNVCPVYKNVGGFAYGWFISGPIGAILLPQLLGTRVARELPYASTLCGACAEACPVKVPFPTILRHLRHRVAEGDAHGEPGLPTAMRIVAGAVSIALTWSPIYEFGGRVLSCLSRVLSRGAWLWTAPYPLSRWTKVRPLPSFDSRFRHWWRMRG